MIWRPGYWIAATVLAVAAVFLFGRLGHYAFWDDEALTALSAQGILRTGDTTAVLGHNIVAYGEGLLLKGGADRSTPPLPAYVTAGAFALGGASVWAARAPFALCGLTLVALMLWWGLRTGAGPRAEESAPSGGAITLLGLGIVGNVSLFLFCRQCRYYGVAPDWIIGFDGHAWLVPKLLHEIQQAGIGHRAVPGPECFGRDVFRPELYLRSFTPITGYDRATQGIYIFRRESAGPAK